MAKKQKTQPKAQSLSAKKKKTALSKGKKGLSKSKPKKSVKKTAKTKKAPKKTAQKKTAKTNQASSKKKTVKKVKPSRVVQKKSSPKSSAKKTPSSGKQKKIREEKTAQKKITAQKKAVVQAAHSKNKPTHFLNYWEEELERILAKNRQVSIKGFEGFEYCFEDNCDQPATTNGYCRYHYMVSWKFIKARNKILSENQLSKWVKELMGVCSPRVLDLMVRDFSNEKDFSQALTEMKILSKN